MASSVIVSGPMACGKTRNSKALASKYNLREIVELDDAAHDKQRLEKYGTLYLTNHPVEEIAELLAKAELLEHILIIPYHRAIAGIRQ